MQAMCIFCRSRLSQVIGLAALTLFTQSQEHHIKHRNTVLNNLQIYSLHKQHHSSVLICSSPVSPQGFNLKLKSLHRPCRRLKRLICHHQISGRCGVDSVRHFNRNHVTVLMFTRLIFHIKPSVRWWSRAGSGACAALPHVGGPRTS